MTSASDFAYQVNGKLEIPYRYMAGAFCSRFLIALRDEKKILGCKCPKCGKVFVPPRTPCADCFVKIEQWVELKGTGVIQNFTVVRKSEPHYPLKPPYVLALIKLDGADTALAHLVGGIEPDKVKVGMKVKPEFAEERKGRITDIKYFQPV